MLCELSVPEHRFATGVWTDGVLDQTTGVIDGNLYVSGRDPSFHYEHGVLLARELNKIGIKQISGDLIVAPGFTMNFSASATRSGERLYDTLDSTLRYAEAVRAWNYERTLLNDRASLETVPSVAVMGAVTVAPVAPAAKLLLTQRSGKLVDILKVLLCYSNNFMADRIGEALGGPDSVRQQLTADLGLGPDEIRIASLSGLGSQSRFAASHDEDLQGSARGVEEKWFNTCRHHARGRHRSRHSGGSFQGFDVARQCHCENGNTPSD